MGKDDVAKTLVEVGQRLDREGQSATCEGYNATSLLKELAVDLIPTLETGAGYRSVHTAETVIDGANEGREDGSPPQMMGRFLLKSEIGRGGMGCVYEARDSELRRSVAVKCFADAAKATGQQLGRFVAEAQITAQLEHPNIVPVYDMGVTLEGQLYFVMRRVKGRSLREVLRLLVENDEERAREWTQHRLLAAFVQICQAVAYAHDRGVVHRDLKPPNIMLGNFGEVLVMDWGIARLTEEGLEEPVDRISYKKTEWGRALGTPGYMSPEQILGQHETVDARSDVWSLGAILYELLTLRKAFFGCEEDVTEGVLTGKLDDPRSCSPERSIPDEIAEIAMKALDVEPSKRYQNAAELAGAVESFLEGSKRREAARDRSAEAERLWREYESLGKELAELHERVGELEQMVAPWAPLSEKRELLDVREAISDLEIHRSELFARVVTSCERALEQDPQSSASRALLARAYASRMAEAEVRRDVTEQRFFEARVRAYDDGSMAVFLEGAGALSLYTDPPGAEVICQRYEQRGLVWSLSPPEVLGTTPLEAQPLAMGSYRMVLRAPGKRDTIYPVHITRGKWWVSGEQPIRLYSGDEIGSGFVYVPPGPFIRGGDPDAPGAFTREQVWLPGFFVAAYPVTMESYCRFVNALHKSDPETAWARVPRATSSPTGGAGQYWRRPGRGERYLIPETDEDGDRWNPFWPVMAVSWADATAYAEWISQQTGIRYFVTPELWWEKAGRGVDGRSYPWGDEFDSSLCKMRSSRPGRPLPEAVGAFQTDVTVYGVCDMAGSIREWCCEDNFDGIQLLRGVRGGSWDDHPRHCRLAHRHDFEHWLVRSQIGLRLARPCPDDT